MKKKIILSNNEFRMMTFEEVLDQFKGMVHQFANEVISKMVYNKPEKDDLVQELNIQVWEAYKRYDGEHAFSTYLHYRLKLGVNKHTMGMYAKKRKNNGLVSLNQELDDNSDATIDKILGTEDQDIRSLAFRDFMNYLEKILTDAEQQMLYSLVNKKDMTVADLAREWGISRVAANNRVRKLKEKVKSVMITTGFVAC